MVLATLNLLSIWGPTMEQSIEDADARGEKMGGVLELIGSQVLRMLMHGKEGMGVPWY